MRLSSAEAVDDIPPQPRFYELHDLGTGPLYSNSVLLERIRTEQSDAPSRAPAYPTSTSHLDRTGVQRAFKHVCYVEVMCEQLHDMCFQRMTRRATHSVDLDLYVPPLASPTKDTPSLSSSVSDLHKAVRQWLGDDSKQILLLHGHSGCGKSL